MILQFFHFFTSRINIAFVTFLLFPALILGQKVKSDYFSKRDNSKIGFHMGLVTGLAKLKTEYYGLYFDDNKLAEVDMSLFGINTGIRFRSLESLSFHTDLEIEYSNGKLEESVIDPILNERVFINEDVYTWLIGVNPGVTLPLYINKNQNISIIAPKIISLNFQIGFHFLAVRSKKDESKSITISEGPGSLLNLSKASYPANYLDTNIQNEDWALFSLSIGMRYFFPKLLGIYLKIQAGTYPISGPGTIKNGTVESSGPPDTWGTYHRIVGGLQFRF